jgi:hypothetical protein
VVALVLLSFPMSYNINVSARHITLEKVKGLLSELSEIIALTAEVRERLGGYASISLESEFSFCSDTGPLQIKFGTRKGPDGEIRYMAAPLIARLQAIGIGAQWDATTKSVLIHS